MQISCQIHKRSIQKTCHEKDHVTKNDDFHQHFTTIHAIERTYGKKDSVQKLGYHSGTIVPNP